MTWMYRNHCWGSPKTPFGRTQLVGQQRLEMQGSQLLALPYTESRPMLFLPNLLPLVGLVLPTSPTSTDDPLVVRLLPDQDNSLFETNDGSLSNGAGERLFAGVTGSGFRRRALLRFDLSVLPPMATILDAQLQLEVSKVPFLPPVTNFAVHRVLAGWGEGASDALAEEGTGAPSEPGDATWLHRYYPNEFWTTPGGDFDPVSSAREKWGAGLGPITWSDGGLRQDVQRWVSGFAPNHGWLIKAVHETNPLNAKRFNSREFAADPTQRPVLTITYTLGTLPCGSAVDCADNPANAASITLDNCLCEAGALNLRLSDAPAGEPAYLLVGTGAGVLLDPPGSAADLCLGGAPIGRFVGDAGVTDGAGAFSTDLLTATSGGGAGGVPDLGGYFCAPAGQTWRFQYWHRSGAQSSFSKALRVTFQ